VAHEGEAAFSNKLLHPQKRVVAYGYRVNEFNSPITSIKGNTKIVVNQWSDIDRRPPMCISLGCHILDFKLPFPDLTDTASNVGGVLKRVAFRHPVADAGLRRELKRFTKRWLHKNLPPLETNTDVSFDTWLSGTKYTERRKEQLRECWRKLVGYLSRKEKGSKSFSKAEAYTAWKHLRGINSRSDSFKCIVGPIFSAIEKVLFKMKWFIKKVPVRGRAKHVYDRLFQYGAKYYATDYSAFESHFDKELMEAVEFQLYEYMTTKIEGGAQFFELIKDVIGSDQTCYYKGFTAFGIQSRMSGEMCTSLGNSFANLMIFLFVCSKAGIREEDVDGFVEGDDGLFRFLPGQAIDDSLFRKLGLTIKIDKQDELHLASFCGLIFDPNSLNIVTDPRKVLAEFGWADTSYVKCNDVRLLELLRAKSLSFAHQYPGCPIVQSVAQYGMRVTRHIDMKRFIAKNVSMSIWSRERLLEAMENLKEIQITVPVTDEARFIVESKFGISVDEQKEIEKMFDEKTVLSPFDLRMPTYMPADWADYYARYVCKDQGEYPNMFGSYAKYDNIPHFTEEWDSSAISSRDGHFSGEEWRHRLWSDA
jgi:hypothetical protein